jgi:hypothetical protein
VNDHRVVVSGGEIYYRSQGSGPLLVLIGGGPSNAGTLAALASELASRLTVIICDRRGYSRSRINDPSQPATMSLHAYDVGDLIDDDEAGAVAPSWREFCFPRKERPSQPATRCASAHECGSGASPNVPSRAWLLHA